MHRDRATQLAVLILAAVLVGFAVASVDPAGGGRVHLAAASSSNVRSAGAPLAGNPLSASLTVSPSSLSEGQSMNVQVTATGGFGSYSYSYSGLPPGCGGQNSPSFSCNPSGTGTFSVVAGVSDSGTNHTQTNSVSVAVTSSSNGNGNGNGNGNNSSGGLSSLFSGFSNILSLLLLFGIVGFATWILLIVGVWVIAITLVRRLPKRGATDPAVAGGRCAACAAPTPAGARFCPACGASTVPKPA
jgi:hypothetical protein